MTIQQDLRQAAQSTWLLVNPALTGIIELLNQAADRIDEQQFQLDTAAQEAAKPKKSKPVAEDTTA